MITEDQIREKKKKILRVENQIEELKAQTDMFSNPDRQAQIDRTRRALLKHKEELKQMELKFKNQKRPMWEGKKK